MFIDFLFPDKFNDFLNLMNTHLSYCTPQVRIHLCTNTLAFNIRLILVTSSKHDPIFHFMNLYDIRLFIHDVVFVLIMSCNPNGFAHGGLNIYIFTSKSLRSQAYYFYPQLYLQSIIIWDIKPHESLVGDYMALNTIG